MRCCLVGRLVMASAVLLSDARALSQLCHREQVTHLLLPPPFLPVLGEAGGLPQGTTLVVGGDAASGALVEQWSAGRRMVNAYGPTEMTVVATTSGDLSGNQTPPISRPLANTRAYVLDGRLQPVPAGVAGELYLAGIQLARGYHPPAGPDRASGLWRARLVVVVSGCTGPGMWCAGTPMVSWCLLAVPMSR